MAKTTLQKIDREIHMLKEAINDKTSGSGDSTRKLQRLSELYKLKAQLEKK